MSVIIAPDFGRNPILSKGDYVRSVECDCCHGLIVSIESRYRYGDLEGQAMEFTIAIPNDEGTWDLESGFGISDVMRVLSSDPELAEEKAGTVLQFEDAKIRVNGPGL
jgi:hypothetical protein